MSELNWFECKVRYEKTLDNGMIKTVTEPFLVSETSYAGAESVIENYLKSYDYTDFSIASVIRKKYQDVYQNDTGLDYYRVKIMVLSLDAKSGTEKKTGMDYIVQANSVEETIKIIKGNLDRTMLDYSLHTVGETQIMDVINL